MKNTLATQQNSLPFLKKKEKWTVVSQGGLAPVGVMLADRNPETVGKLVLASPPTWKDMTNGVPESELAKKYNVLKSPVLGKLAFNVLESRKVIELFFNPFFFSDPCHYQCIENI